MVGPPFLAFFITFWPYISGFCPFCLISGQPWLPEWFWDHLSADIWKWHSWLRQKFGTKLIYVDTLILTSDYWFWYWSYGSCREMQLKEASKSWFPVCVYHQFCKSMIFPCNGAIFTLGHSWNKELGTDPEQRLYLACHHSSRPVDSGLCFDSLHISILLALAPLTFLQLDTWSTHALLGLGEIKCLESCYYSLCRALLFSHCSWNIESPILYRYIHMNGDTWQ